MSYNHCAEEYFVPDFVALPFHRQNPELVVAHMLKVENKYHLLLANVNVGCNI